MNELRKELRLKELSSGAYGQTEMACERGKILETHSPIDGALLASFRCAANAEYDRVVEESQACFLKWRIVPAPQRGLLVRDIAEKLREHKKSLGRLVSLETGKIIAEGEGEIQEAIDIADFALGLSRQLYGKTMHSERPLHRMYEQWHPLGPVGVITAFNFPAAVWAWNAMVAVVCGDTIVWKPSEKTPLTALAINNIAREVATAHGFPALFSLLLDNGPELGKKMAADTRIPLVSATGSCAMGRSVAESVSKRLGRSLLELGGNNGIIALADADLKLLIPSVVFGAVGTAGQRCTTTRRLIVVDSIVNEVIEKLKHAYHQLKVGNPLESGNLVGPLIDKAAVDGFRKAIAQIKTEGGEILFGGEVLSGMPSELYVRPTIVRARADMKIVGTETFAPILYVIPVSGLDEAIKVHNAVTQGLSSSVFTSDVRAAETFLSAVGSDCGIANVNIGTSGAEIGGAFGGEKETGGGREAGSDSWQQYMRRQTSTINWSDKLPLAQGIKFQ